MQITSAALPAYPSTDAPLARRQEADTTQNTEPDEPSSMKSFAYGALGLERPEVQAASTNGFYTAGKWVAAAATIGGIVSLFV